MLVLIGLVMLVAATPAAAQDETAPVVVVPEDIPGADVIVFRDDTYTFDASKSYDDVGITGFMFEFLDQDIEILLLSTDGTEDYTFTQYGQTWVFVTAFDAAGNEGVGAFSIDIVERITSDVIIANQVGTITHSLYVDNADIIIENSTLYFEEGAGTGPSGGGAAPDQLGESLTPDGDLAGHWEPYYYWYYGHDGSYGTVLEDYNTKMSGELSIRAYKRYHYGFEYHFNGPVDLTEYKTLTFWMHSQYSSCRMYYIYFWGTYGSYGGRYIYTYMYYQGPGYAAYRGWYGYSVSLDFNRVGYPARWYGGMYDLSQIYAFRIYMYGYNYNMWIDHVGFSEAEYGDQITESNRPGGDLAGRWQTSYGSPSTQSHHYVGSYSVGLPLRSSYNYIDYFFNSPADLSQFQSMRFFNYFSSYYYLRWNSMQFYVYDASGRYCYYYMYSYYYLNYYASYNYGKWYLCSVPWGPGPTYYNRGVDFTEITRIRFNNVYSYRYGTLYVDGLEWLAAGEGGPGTSGDNVGYAIYTNNGDMTVHKDSNIIGLSKTGARLRCMGGTGTFQESHFNNIWHTESYVAKNYLNSFGGIEVYGDAILDNITFLNCQGPGIALFDGSLTCNNPQSIDLKGTTLKAKGSPKLIVGATERTTGNVGYDITGWTLSDSAAGTGLLIMTRDTNADLTVWVHGNELDGNAHTGVAVTNYGGACDLEVEIYDQVIDRSGSYGFGYWAGQGEWSPGTVAELKLDNVTLTNSGEEGLAIYLANGATDLKAEVMNSFISENDANGIGHLFEGFFGTVDLTYFNITIEENDACGIAFQSIMTPWVDSDGNSIHPVADVEVSISQVYMKANNAWGLWESHDCEEAQAGGVAPPWPWAGPTRSSLTFNVTCYDVTILESSAGGWYFEPDEGWNHGNFEANRYMENSSIDDNRGPGVYIEPNHYLYGSGASVKDIWMFDNTRIIDNARGVVQYLGSGNYGYYSEIHLDGCRIEGSDEEAIYIYGSTSTDGIYTWGTSRVLGAMVYVDSCRMNSPARFEMLGANDEGSPDWNAKMGVQFTNNIVDTEEPLVYRLGAYPWCEDFLAWGEIGNNRFYKDIPEDGVSVELWGGMNLEMDFTVRDQSIKRLTGSGINVVTGTLYQGIDPHQTFGVFRVDNMTVTGIPYNGVNFTVDHREVIGAKSRGVLEVRDCNFDGGVYGVYATDVSGRFYDTVLSDFSSETVLIRFSVFDFYSCEVGPVTTDNIKVFTKGAARMWFDVAVDVKWASGARVVGAVISVQDNIWSTIGVDTVSEDAAVPFGYVNSYTVLPDSVYSRSPYLVSANYLGLETESLEDVDRNKVIDLVMVDDIQPKLTVNEPLNNAQQTSTTLKVKGHAWDLHSGLDKVMVSLDGEMWYEATGNPDFEYTFEDVEEGPRVLRIKAIDFAGNERVELIAVLVDATPPTLIIIEPEQDEFMTQNPDLVVSGVTELGSTVSVHNEAPEMDITLFRTSIHLMEGPNEVRVVARDPLGNTAVHVIRVTLDTIGPPLIVTAPLPDEILGSKQVTITGQTEPGAKVTVNGLPVANLDGQFTTNLRLLDGEHTIVVMASDEVGNSKTVSVPIIVDTKDPWLELVAPIGEQVYGADGIPVEGWVEPGSIVLINDQIVTVTDGHFSTVVFGSEGIFLITVTVVDGAGNDLQRSEAVWVDTTSPTIVLEGPEDGLVTSMGYVEVKGKLLWDEREIFRDVNLMMNGEFAPFSEMGDFMVRFDLAEGTNPIVIEAEDSVGNSVTKTVTIIKDSTAPFLLAEVTPTFLHEVWAKPATYDGQVFVEGDTEPGAFVTVDGAEVMVDEAGHFRVSILLDAVPEGEELVQRAIHIEAWDAAGNTREQDLSVVRLKEAEKKDFADYESSQYWVLILSLIILIGAILAAWLFMRSTEAPVEEEMTGYGGR